MGVLESGSSEDKINKNVKRFHHSTVHAVIINECLYTPMQGTYIYIYIYIEIITYSYEFILA